MLFVQLFTDPDDPILLALIANLTPVNASQESTSSSLENGRSKKGPKALLQGTKKRQQGQQPNSVPVKTNTSSNSGRDVVCTFKVFEASYYHPNYFLKNIK